MRTIPDWHHYFMSLAEVAATRSKDPVTTVGCVIVDANNRIMSVGYNGFPVGTEESEELWTKSRKHEFVVHAEDNAISYCKEIPIGAKLYTTLLPCTNCTQLIINSGIKEVYYRQTRYNYPEVKIKFHLNNIKLIKVP